MSSPFHALPDLVLGLPVAIRQCIRRPPCYKAGSPSETQTYVYDIGANAKGRLTQVTDPAAATTWSYAAQGRVAGKVQTVGTLTRTVGYAYNAAGQLATLTTPSGQQIGYTYANHRINGITVNGAALIASVATTPFGPLAAWEWSNGFFDFHDYDLDGRSTGWEYRNGTSLLRSNVAWDVASRITAISDPANPGISGAYQYDALDRLTVAQSGNPVTHTQQFAYDAVGNRLNATIDAQLTNYTYPASSNRLAALAGAVSKGYTYDGAGNPTTIGANVYNYSLANRLIGIPGVAAYQVNALGQRVAKTLGTTTTYFVHDEQGHLLGEYDGTGALIQETVWLENLPLATLRPNGAGNPAAVYYVHADHLGTPRAVSRPADNVLMWRWDNVDPFGANAANENPAGAGTFKYGLRFPGQYYDAETGTHYNYFRDYDPTVGRYVQSDPIGLAAGVNTYAYVLGNPLGLIDRLGLASCCSNKECRMQCISVVLFDKVVCNRFERCPGEKWTWVGQEVLWAPSRPFFIYGELSCDDYRKWKSRPRPPVPGIPDDPPDGGGPIVM